MDIQLNPTEPDEKPRLELTGIGAVLSAKGDVLVIGRLLPEGGAVKAGLVVGDAIVAVDGVSVVTLGFQGSIQKIRGPEGTTVVLRVRRVDGTVQNLVVERRRIQG